jgi:hypothetical protein
MKMSMLAALAISSSLFAQGVSLGLRAGVPITPMLTSDGQQQVSGQRYTIGALIEVRWWRGAGVGADFLLNRTGLAISPAGSRRAEVWRWEAPISIIYHFRAPTEPFARVGVSFNRVFDISGAVECGRGPFGEQFYCLQGSSLVELRHRGTFGFVAGGGLRFRAGKVSLEPEVRLTHWIDRNFGVRDSDVRSNLNQIGLLLGVIF